MKMVVVVVVLTGAKEAATRYLSTESAVCVAVLRDMLRGLHRVSVWFRDEEEKISEEVFVSIGGGKSLKSERVVWSVVLASSELPQNNFDFCVLSDGGSSYGVWDAEVVKRIAAF